MKVNINGIWYDSEKQPIQIELTNSDKNNIMNMHDDKFNYISFPNNLNWGEVQEILKIKK